MVDTFSDHRIGLSSPYEHMVQFVPSDNEADNLAQPTRSIYSGGTGNISFVTMNNETVMLQVIKGLILPVRVVRVNATGTTVVSIIGLW